MKQKAETKFQQVRMYLNGRQLQMQPTELPIDFQCPVKKNSTSEMSVTLSRSNRKTQS
jgi:hypothetical protein